MMLRWGVIVAANPILIRASGKWLKVEHLQAIADFAELEYCSQKRLRYCCTFSNDLEKARLRSSATIMHSNLECRRYRRQISLAGPDVRNMI